MKHCKLLGQTVAVAFGMFSAIPFPQPEWNQDNMRYALCAFPFIGLFCGGAWTAWGSLCRWLGLPNIAQAAGLCLAPVLVTGGIHLDGLTDTGDALASWGDATKKQEILKDSHVGAFAVIRLCGYFVATFGLCGAVRFNPLTASCMTLGFVLERALSGLAIATFPLAKNTGLAHTFATSADRVAVRRFLLILSVLIAVGLLFLSPLVGGGMLLMAGLAFRNYYKTATEQFGGTSGDLAGWFLQRAELWMLGAVALLPYLEDKLR